MYFTTLKFDGSNLTIPVLKDHGFTWIDGKPQVIIDDDISEICWLKLENFFVMFGIETFFVEVGSEQLEVPRSVDDVW